MTTVECPHCKKPVEWSEKSPFRPFCSERCRTIDLGAWASNAYAIPTNADIEDPESVSESDPENESDPEQE